MEHYTHSIGRFGRGLVNVQSGNLRLYCNDTASVGRIFDGLDSKKITPFGRGWELTVSNKKGAVMDYSNGHLTMFKDENGKEYRFFYNGGLLSCIGFDDGMICYDYNADGMLTRVTYPNGQKAEISYRDIYYVYDINVTDKEGNGLLAVSYADYYYNDKVGCIYEYTYDGRERKEQKFVDFTNPHNIITLSH